MRKLSTCREGRASNFINGREIPVTFADFAVTYLIPAGIVLLIVLGLMRYFAVRGTASETNFKE